MAKVSRGGKIKKPAPPVSLPSACRRNYGRSGVDRGVVEVVADESGSKLHALHTLREFQNRGSNRMVFGKSLVYVFPMDEASKPSDGRSAGRPRIILRWLVGFAAVLLVYPLSFGPVAKLATMGIISSATANKIYAPLKELCRNSVYTEDLLDWYRRDVWKAK